MLYFIPVGTFLQIVSIDKNFLMKFQSVNAIEGLLLLLHLLADMFASVNTFPMNKSSWHFGC